MKGKKLLMCVLGLVSLSATPISAATTQFYSDTTSSIESLVAKQYKVQKERKEMLEDTKWLEKYDIKNTDLSEERLKVLDLGTELLGTPYVYGGTSRRGFDCSGFTQYVFNNAVDVNITRTSSSQPYSGKMKEIDIKDAKSGDLAYRVGSHAMIFIANKDGQLIVMHSPNSGDVVKVAPYHTRRVRVFRPNVFKDGDAKKEAELKRAEEEEQSSAKPDSTSAKPDNTKEGDK